jgi:hypothetical protein
VTQKLLALALLSLFVLSAVPPAIAHDDPNSGNYNLLIPGDFWSGSIAFVTLVGPPAGEEILHTTFHVTFSSPPGGTPASEVVFELKMPLVAGFQTWVLHGTDFGWPTATGTYSATLGSAQLNGVLSAGLFGFSTPELAIGAVNGGLTGQYISSTIALELAGEACQTDLGFAGPGAVSLSVCGDVLSTGGTATLAVTGAPAFAPVFLAVGVNFGPAAFKGGTLVPVPLVLALPFAADGAGTLMLPVPGGGGPLTAYLQAVVQDGAQPAGYALSNALQIELLP